MTPHIEYWTAKWCGPCKTFLPKVKALCEKNGWSLHVRDFDDKENRDAALALNIQSVPTLIMQTPDGPRRLNSDQAGILQLKKAMGL